MFTPSPSVPFLIFSMHNLISIIGYFFCTNKKKPSFHRFFKRNPGRDGDRNDENKENMQSNGLIQNGLDEENVFRYSLLEFHRKTSITTHI
jgi:hypothetical protein